MARLRTILFTVSMAGSVCAQVLGGSEAAEGGTVVEVATQTAVEVATSSPDANADAATPSPDDGSVTAFLDSPLQTQSVSPVVAAQATVPAVVSIYFPGADALPYVASMIGESDGAQTLAISCGPGVNSDACGFPSSVTVTAGPSTAYVSVSNEEATFIYDCKITGSTAAVCTETFNGDAAYIATASGTGAASGKTSSVIVETLGSADITWMPITITAPGKGATATASSVSTASTAKGTDSDTSYPDGGVSWANQASLGGKGSDSASASASASQPVSASTAPAASQSTGPAGVTMPSASKSYGIWPASYTGGAGERLGALGTVAAGLLALAGMVV